MHPTKILITFLGILSSHFCEQDLKLKIAMPEFICDKDGSVKDITTDMTTIRLLGNDAQTVDYKFSVNFKRIGNSCQNNQRCTLLTWRAVRELEDYLRKYPTKDGLIQINNTMFLPGIQYILSVTMVGADNVIEEKILTMDYVDADVKKSVEKPMASLLLLGADSSYAFTDYFINAENAICSNITDYYYNWELFDESGNSVEKFYDKSSELKILPNTMTGLKSYSIRCDLMDMQTGNSIANSQQNLNVLSKGLQLNLPYKQNTVSTNQPITIQPFIRDLDNTKSDLNLTWSCVNEETKEDFDYRVDATFLEIESGFPIEGNFLITVEAVRNDGLKETASCRIRVLEKVPTIEIDVFESPVSPSNGLVVHVTVYELVTFCTVQWISPSEDGYEPLNLKSVPGNIDAIDNITQKEDLFLNELDDFTDGTVEKSHDLNIPVPTDSWEGLKGDVIYLFRLIVTCPVSIENDIETDNQTVEPILNYGQNKVISADLEIKTNAAPEIQIFDVTPKEGEAFLTQFTFKAEKAQDKEGDGPILYKFGFNFGNKTIVLRSLSDITTVEIVLPYYKDGIQTTLEVCDVFVSCKKILGPKIVQSLPSVGLSVDYANSLMKMFTEKINADDYYRAFAHAVSVFDLYQTFNNSNNNIRDFVHTKIGSEIQKWVNFEEGEDTKWKSAANSLILNIDEFQTELQLPESILTNLGKLKDKLSDVDLITGKYSSRKLMSFPEHDRIRLKRSNNPAGDEVKRYIGISELIITTSNNPDKVNTEKENLRIKLHNYIKKLCQTGTKRFQLEFKTLILSVERINKNSPNSYIYIPSEQNSWNNNAKIKFGSKSRHPNNFCIGKAVMKDYLGKIGNIFKVEVMDDRLEPITTNLTVLLPLDKIEKRKPQCATFLNNDWNSNNCNTIKKMPDYLQCACSQPGVYYLEYMDVTDEVIPILSTSQPSIITNVATSEHPVVIIPTSTLVTHFENINKSSNSTVEDATHSEIKHENYETLSYVIIAGSLVGIALVAFILQRLHREEDEEEPSENFDFPKYAHLYDEEMLNDAHI